MIRKGRQKARELEEQQHSKQWAFFKERNATKIWTHRSKDGFICVKSERDVHYSVKEIVEAFENFEVEKKVYDKTSEMKHVKEY